MGKYIEQLNDRMNITDASNYHRQAFQSYMTAPEWRNVELSEEFAVFMKDGHSMFQFTYFSQIFEIWRVLFHSYQVARKYDSAYEILTSEYMVMDLFVTIFTTSELLPKALMSLLLYPILGATNNSTMQNHLAEYFALYATELKTNPFFLHDFKKHRTALAEKYNACEDKTWCDWFTWMFISLELLTKQWISQALQADFEESPATTDILVKFDVTDTDASDVAILRFNDALKTAITHFESNLSEKNLEDDIHIVDNHVYVKDKKEGKDHMSVYARLTAPRYTDFRQAIAALEKAGIYIQKIAGQDHVQVKCELNAKDAQSLERDSQHTLNTANATPLFSYHDSFQTSRKFCFFDVKVKNMHETLKLLEKPLGDLESEQPTTSQIKFIHNF